MERQENWKIVPETNDIYEVSDFGRIRRRTSAMGTRIGYTTFGSSDGLGYKKFNLRVPGKPRRVVRVHTLVAAIFIGEIPPLYEVNHINSNRSDNRVENLEIVTRGQNCLHAYRSGSRKKLRGEECGIHKLTNEDVHIIKYLWKKGTVSYSVLALLFSVSIPSIKRIVDGSGWIHID